jgi:hypothetical protein
MYYAYCQKAARMLRGSRQSSCQYQQMLTVLVWFATESVSDGGMKSSHPHQRGREKRPNPFFHVKVGPSRHLDSTAVQSFTSSRMIYTDHTGKILLPYLFSLDHRDVDCDVLNGMHTRQGLRQPKPRLYCTSDELCRRMFKARQ